MGLFFTKCIPSSTFLWHSEIPSMNFLRSNKNQRFDNDGFSMIRNRVVMNHLFQFPLKGAKFFTPRCTRVLHSTRYITTTSILQCEHKKHSWGNRMDPFRCIILIGTHLQRWIIQHKAAEINQCFCVSPLVEKTDMIKEQPTLVFVERCKLFRL